MTVLLVFVDGIGQGRPGAQNPFDGAPVEALRTLAGLPPARAVECALVDATLGHDGLPQSATGQACLYTGVDCIAAVGGHRTGFPVGALSRMIVEYSIFARARAAGLRAGLLNAYPRARAEHIARVVRGEEPRPRHFFASASALAAAAGGGTLLTLEDAWDGRAATYDLTGEHAHAYGLSAPLRTPAVAASVIMRAAREYDVALFELFLTDKAGHSQDMVWARHEIARTDRFLTALFAEATRTGDLVVVTSDHGNLEDLSTRSHTRAPVPVLAVGDDARGFIEAVSTRGSGLDRVGEAIFKRALRDAGKAW